MLRSGMFLGGRYEILAWIGSGGMSDVYRAKCHKLNRYVAIKVLKREYNNDTTFVSKFQAEAEAAAGLVHPNIVNVYDVGREGDIYYIVMELAEGVTLKQYIQNKGKLEIAESISIAMQIAQGIETAHRHNIVHRDIKPQNIIISADGRVKVTDFGIAKAASTQTISSNTMGSVHYISPEQARGGYCDERSDIYSLGITMYEMLTGRVPFEGDSTVAVALQHIQGEMIPPRMLEPVIPVSIEKIILKCTQKKPEQRYTSATELIVDLKRALMTPDEDFVKAVQLNTDGPTIIFSDEDAQRIKAEAKRAAAVRNNNEAMAEQAYQLGIEDEEEDSEPEESDSFEDEEDEDVDHRFERIVTVIGVVVAVIIALLALYVAGRAFGVFSSSRGSKKPTETYSQEEEDGTMTTMPSVIGDTKEKAEEKLKEASLGRRFAYDYSDKYPEGYVIAQEYEAGSKISKNTQVLLTLSSGSSTVTIPESILGMSETAARRALKNLGLEVEVRTGYDDNSEPGEVYDCEPAIGGLAPIGSTVTIYISQGPEVTTTVVPDLYNRPEADGLALLQQSGLKAGLRTEQPDEVVAAGNIVGQSVIAGTTVEAGTEVAYIVSTGSSTSTTVVPNLLGEEEERAASLLAVNKLNLGTVTQEFDNSAPVGTVIWQSEASGSTVAEGTVVNVIVSKGKDAVTVPNIMNHSQSEAQRSLAESGLVGNHDITKDSYHDSVPANAVIGMDHTAGDQVGRGTMVNYWLSLGPAPVEQPDDGGGVPVEGQGDYSGREDLPVQ